jgi:CRP/FNR family transcriptional regulator, cyclic AMP receptor protein
MISPELLRRYPFFGNLSDAQLKSIAMIAEEVSWEKGVIVLEECEPANYFFLLLEGDVDLFYRSEDKLNPKTRKDFLVGEINAGEIFAISALIEPYVYSASVKTARQSRAIKFDAIELRKLFDQDANLSCLMMTQVAKAAMERLAYARVQLAAAWSE